MAQRERQMTSTEWGVPNWQQGSAYPNKLSERLWRWEFTRRREDYRGAWDTHAEETHSRLTAEGRQNLINHNNLDFLADIPGSRGRFGIPGMCPNPRNPTPRVGGPGGPILLPFARSGGLWSPLRPDRQFHLKVAENQRATVFNLAAPIESQINAVRHNLREQQKREFGRIITVRRHTRLWPLYLRIIDGRDQGATYEKIGATLISSDCSDDVADYDAYVNLEPKAWAAKRHAAAIEVTFKGWP